MMNFERYLIPCMIVLSISGCTSISPEVQNNLNSLSTPLRSQNLSESQIYNNSIGMEFVLIPEGSFMMGTVSHIENGGNDEHPQHKVIISKPFYIGKYEVTQEQWQEVMGNNPAWFKGRKNPVESVSWEDVQEFIKRLNEREGHNRYRLPTEAEWEYAARANTSSIYCFGNNANELSDYAWYHANSRGKPHPVGQKSANAWGLHDVHGNVWEWVQDWYGEAYYTGSEEINPNGPESGSFHVFRGGAWEFPAEHCRSGNRGYLGPGHRYYLGFRLALSPE